MLDATLRRAPLAALILLALLATGCPGPSSDAGPDGADGGEPAAAETTDDRAGSTTTTTDDAAGGTATAPATGDEPGDGADVSMRRTRDGTAPTRSAAEGEAASPAPIFVQMTTSLGDMVFRLRPDVAPLTVENFLAYAEEDFYDGTIFHRVNELYLAQGGGFTPDLERKQPTRPPIPNEAGQGLNNVQGTIAMARAGNDPDSATTQFFINFGNNEGFDRTATAAGYAVFGELVAGSSTLSRIQKTPVRAVQRTPTGREVRMDGVPEPAVIIEDVVRLDPEAARDAIVALMTEDARARTEAQASDMPAAPVEHVVLETSMGDVVLALDRTKAPVSVRNFLEYVESGHYDGTIFHRVIPGFMIQGGGFTPDLTQKPTSAPIANEWQNGLSNVRGSIAMARVGGNPDSATSQFFINVVDNARLDQPQFDGAAYAVFGEVIAGMDVVDEIRAGPTEKVGRHGHVPVEPVLIEAARRITAEQAAELRHGGGDGTPQK